MFKLPLSLVIASIFSLGATATYAADPATCSSSFYCYGSDATPAGATPVRIVVEGANDQGTLINTVNRSVGGNTIAPTSSTAPARPAPVVANRVAPTPVATRPTVQPTRAVATPQPRPVVTNFAARPAILDANLPPATPVRRVVVAPAPRTQPTTSVVSTRPTPIRTAAIASTSSCSTLMDKATKAESQGVTFAKSGQSNLSRQAFQSAAGFRTQAKSLNCSV